MNKGFVFSSISLTVVLSRLFYKISTTLLVACTAWKLTSKLVVPRFSMIFFNIWIRRSICDGFALYLLLILPIWLRISLFYIYILSFNSNASKHLICVNSFKTSKYLSKSTPKQPITLFLINLSVSCYFNFSQIFFKTYVNWSHSTISFGKDYRILFITLYAADAVLKFLSLVIFNWISTIFLY